MIAQRCGAWLALGIGAMLGVSTASIAQTATPGGADTSAAQGVQGWTDANILAHLATGDSLEVETAKLAQQRTQNAQVRQLAQMLINDHSKNQQQGLALAKKAGITPQPAPSDTTPQHVQNEMSRWESDSSPAQFDREWLTFQVEHHSQDLAMLPKLQKQAQSGALKSFIGQTVPVIRKHYDQVRSLQQQSASAGGPGASR
jgi:putative membrane protein